MVGVCPALSVLPFLYHCHFLSSVHFLVVASGGARWKRLPVPQLKLNTAVLLLQGQ